MVSVSGYCPVKVIAPALCAVFSPRQRDGEQDAADSQALSRKNGHLGRVEERGQWTERLGLGQLTQWDLWS